MEVTTQHKGIIQKAAGSFNQEQLKLGESSTARTRKDVRVGKKGGKRKTCVAADQGIILSFVKCEMVSFQSVKTTSDMIILNFISSA